MFLRFLGESSTADETGFEEVCQDHPDLEPALRALYSLHLDAGGETTIPADAPGTIDELPVSRLGELGEGSTDAIGEDAPGEEIGPYHLVELLGEGGFGRVYLAEQHEPVRRQVALKIIKAGMDTREVIRRFEAERQALASLDHPNISRVYDFGTTDRGRPYFVMELVSGEPIHRFCDRESLDLEQRLELFLGVCEAIQHAHQRAIIHRDIKPSNILVHRVDGRPVPKVIDFGIAKATEESLTGDTLFTRAGQVVGTPAYMSPEQASGDPAAIDVRTDVYSLGVLLYELLTGLLPLGKETLQKARNVADIQRLIREEEPPRPSQKILQSLAGERAEGTEKLARLRGLGARSLARRLRGDLDWIVLRALEKQRDRRYGSVLELAADLERHRDHRPVLAGPPDRLYVLGKFLRKHRLAVSVVLGAIAITLIMTGLGRLRRLDEAAELVERGRESYREYSESEQTVERLRALYEDQKERFEPWQPTWEREPEFRALRDLEHRRRELRALYSEAIRLFNQAEEVAPPRSGPWKQARGELARIHFEEWRQALRGRSWTLPPEYYRDRIQDLGVREYDEEFEGRGQVFLRIEPPGVDVHVFRYSRSEEHLVPLEFSPELWRERPGDPESGVTGRPFLVVEQVWNSLAGPLRPGDRLVEIDGKPVSTRGELAASLRGRKVGEVVRARVLRVPADSAEPLPVELEWTPFPVEDLGEIVPEARSESCPYEPGRLVNLLHQLGLTFEGYPLEFSDRSRLRPGEPGARIELELPRGSYLLVFRKEGHVTARHPVSLPENRGVELAFRLPRVEEVPGGFVWIPPGPAGLGGDPEAFQSLEYSTGDLDGFFLGRYEVTVGEYLRFLNSPGILARTDLDGRLEVEAADGPGEWIRIVPFSRGSGRPLMIRERLEDPWSLRRENNRWDESWPITAISREACLRYLQWRNETEGQGWVYGLPDDREWEKAARGTDRRIYVWGDAMVWTHCWNRWTFFESPSPGVVGAMPLDESVFGVRDLAGSVCEYTLGHPDPSDPTYLSYRGGSWNVNQESFYRLATRNGLTAPGVHLHMGFRLKAWRASR